MIGVSHHDVQGKEHLERALEEERPDIITVESGPKNYRYVTSSKFAEQMKDMINFARRVVSNRDIELLNTLNYEFFVVHKYARTQGIPVHTIDPYRDSFIFKTHKKDFKNFNRSKISQLVTEISTMELTEGELELYRFWFNYEGSDILELEQDHIDTILLQDPSFPKSRDITPAANLCKIVANMDYNEKLVHIAGIAHLCRDIHQRTLYEKIRDLNPKRRSVRSY